MAVINIYFFQICIVHGISMEPTLREGEIVLIKKSNLDLNYNDIVVIKKDKNILIKRLVGLPNDTIRIQDYLFVNGEKFDNIFTEEKGDLNGIITLNSDEFFVLGDNRQNSIDSRFQECGTVKRNEIIGKIIFNKGGI